MNNREIAQKFSEISDMLEILDNPKDQFRVVAYHNASRNIEMLSQELDELYRRQGIKGLKSIPGIGESIADKIEELINTGKIHYHQELAHQVPAPVLLFLKIPGVGPITALKLFQSYKVKNISDLKKNIVKDKTEKYFKAKSKENILRDIEMLGKMSGRMLLSFAEPIAREIVETLKSYKEIKQADAVGSLRRMKETIGDIDVVASANIKNQKSNVKSKDHPIIERFIHEPFVGKCLSHGETKATILHKKGVQVDLELLPDDQYGSLLQHFTGSKEHNIALRTWAEKHGFSVSEHGIKKVESGKSSVKRQTSNTKIIKCETEEKVYKTFGMDTPEPEIRENQGEIEAALNHKLPKIITLGNIQGDLHMHTHWSEGEETMEKMAIACKKLGYKYIAITDHTSGLGIAHGLKGEDVQEYINEARHLSKKLGIKILAGAEVNIMADGSLDLSDKYLAKLDFVIASVHSGFRQEKEKMTQRIIKAITNTNVNALGHPTGRLIEKRNGIEADWEKIFQIAGKNKVAMEINAQADRLDLNDSMILLAKKYRVKFIINTDSHSISQLQNMRYGVAMARRGWCEKKDILNTLSLSQFSAAYKH